MDKIALASSEQRKRIFIDVASKLNIAPYIIEKDFWVSWALGKIFTDPQLSKILCFKGGTSLSKAFGLIERFSEDIDLILSQNIVLNNGEVLNQTSNTKQSDFNKIIEERAGKYISYTLKENLKKIVDPICSVKTDDSDNHILSVIFPNVFDYVYIQPSIKLEIGPLALWNPNEQYKISSFVSKALPELNLTDPNVPTIKPERTFWEKITILHHEHHRPQNSSIPARYSRHYYDIYKMGQNDVKNIALTNLKLLDEVVSFKKRFYPRGWAKYDEAVSGIIRLLPSKENQQILADDYAKMQNMIYGKTPSWSDIIAYLMLLEQEINSLK